MKTLTRFMAPATALILLTGCASNHSDLNAPAQTRMDDQFLQLRIATALSDNPDYKFTGVNVTVSNGTARLGGEVDLFEQKVKAGNIVMEVSGVKDVEDDILVKPPGTANAGDSGDDQSLTAMVKNVLSENSEYRYTEVTVAVFQGTVQLSGFVDTIDQKNQASDLARAIPGVKDVSNNITVKAIL